MTSKGIPRTKTELYLKLSQQWAYDIMGAETEYATFDEILDGFQRYIALQTANVMRGTDLNEVTEVITGYEEVFNLIQDAYGEGRS